MRVLSRDMTGSDLRLEDYLDCSVGNTFRQRVEARKQQSVFVSCGC